MILIKPRIVEMDTIDREATLRKIESAARNCYQSAMASTTEGSAKFVAGLVRSGHMAPVELGGMFNVKIQTSRSVLAELTRHRLTSFCVTGDTVVKSFSTSGKRWTVEQLYNYQEDKNKKGRLNLISIRSVNEETLTIVPNKIEKVLYNGEKDVFELTLESGRKIKCTSEHEIFTPNGYKSLSELCEGDFVYSNGTECLENPEWLYHNYVELGRSTKEISKEIGCAQTTVGNKLRKYNIKRPFDVRYKVDAKLFLLDDKEWLYHNYIELNRQRKEIAEEIGCCESIVNKAFHRYNIKKPKSRYPNRQPGGNRKGWSVYTEEAKARIIAAHSGPNSNWWKEDRDSVKISGGYSEAHAKMDKIKKEKTCAFCGKPWDDNYKLEIHHMDKNPKNNNENNIKLLCPKCHHLYHKTWALGVFSDKIVSIKYVGIEKVYDLQMADPYHNFVANGIVVHNCVESQRYVNEAKNQYGVSFIIPTNINESEPDITEGYYEIAMVPIGGQGGQIQGIGMQIATASINDDGKLGLVRQVKCKDTTGAFLQALAAAEQSYAMLLQMGYAPQDAREVLPNATACTITMGANLREWKHIFNLRVFGTTGKPYAPCKEIMSLVYQKFHEALPEIFPDETPSENGENSEKVAHKTEPSKKSSILYGV